MAVLTLLSAIITMIISLVASAQIASMFANLIIWFVYGIFAGTIARFAMSSRIEINFWQSVGVGIAGSYAGGLIKWVFGYGFLAVESSGVVMGCVGAIVLLFMISLYKKPMAQ